MERRSSMLPEFFAADAKESKTTDDGRNVNPAVMSFIRDEYVAKKMKEREAEFTEQRTLRAFVGTWNVNGKKPRERLDGRLCAASGGHVGRRAAGPLRRGLSGDGGSDRRQRRPRHGGPRPQPPLAAAHPGDGQRARRRAAPAVRYDLLDTQYLVGVMVCVLVKRAMRPHVSAVAGATAGVGIGGFLGNKGGAAVRMRIFDSTVCFVCAHLAAHRGNVQGRNANFRSINEKFVLDAWAGRTEDEPESLAMETAEARWRSELSIEDHEIVVWLGDFNYRIAADVPTSRVFAMVDAMEVRALAAKDQLNQERAAGRVFRGFHEAPLGFLPTYKYQPGTARYERRPEKKLRAPLGRTASSGGPARWPAAPTPHRGAGRKIRKLRKIPTQTPPRRRRRRPPTG